MKKYILLSTFLFFSSCLGVKKIFTNNKSVLKTEKSAEKKDSIFKKEISKAIVDDFIIPIKKVETDNIILDALVNKEVERILSNINTRKKSGNNSYSVKWNKKRKSIDINIKIGRTVDSNTKTKSSKTAISKSETITFNSVYKKITTIPWYLIVIAIIVFLPTLMKFFSPHVALISKFLPKMQIVKK